MMAGIFAMDRSIVVIIAVVVLFGSSQLPKNIRSAGRPGVPERSPRGGGEVVPVEEEPTTSCLGAVSSQSGRRSVQETGCPSKFTKLFCRSSWALRDSNPRPQPCEGCANGL